MSRIIVKCLPKKISSERIRDHFTGLGEISDLQLKYTPAGVFRQFAFIGFKDPEAADKAVKQFNNTYIDTSKLVIEPYQDSSKPVKLQLEEKAQQKKEKLAKKKVDKKANKQKVDPFAEVKDDPQFAEFLKLQRNVGSKNRMLWSNDAEGEEEKDEQEIESGIEDDHETPAEEDKGEKKQKAIPKELFAYTIKVSGLPNKCNHKKLKTFFAKCKPASIRLPPKSKGFAFISFKTEADFKQAMVKHRSFLEGHRIELRLHKSGADGGNESTAGTSNQQTSGDTNDKKNRKYNLPDEGIADSGRMFVRNLPYTCTEEDLEETLGKYGPISELHLPIDKETKKLKGFAFVTFTFPEHAVKAFTELDKTLFQGRLLHLIPAHAKPDGHHAGLVGDKSSFKAKKELQNKQTAGHAFNWNTLFLGADAVAEVMADRLNVDKQQLVANPDDKQSVAVRMALGETQLVNETRKFLVDNGVDLDAFNQEQAKRSKTVILVKNLPAKTDPEEVRALFAKFGSVNRVILPTHGITAIVEMQERTEAKVAFEKLAYFSFKHTPIYLEWAPRNLFASSKKVNAESGQDATADQPEEQQSVEPAANSSTTDDASNAEGRSLFIRNINTSTTDKDFEEHFAKCGRIESARIARRRDAGPTGTAGSSLGYGFIVYQYRSSAQKALKQLQNSSLDDHCLQVNLSRKPEQPKSSATQEARPGRREPGPAPGQPSTKISVRNIPFEAKPSEVEELFRAFGHLKSVRMPLKFGENRHRGFGFVEFVTKQDAKRAFEAMCSSTHLYGRRLVLEWAAVDDDDQVQQKSSTEGPPSKRLKKSDLVNKLES